MLYARELLIAILSVGVSQAAGDRSIKYEVRLSLVPTDVALQATVSGGGAVDAQLRGPRLTLSGTFEGLQSPATTANLHMGRKTGLRGPVVAALVVSNAKRGTIHGDVQLTPSQVDGLRDGRLYVLVHSEGAPDGNLWGWLLPAGGSR